MEIRRMGFVTETITDQINNNTSTEFSNRKTTPEQAEQTERDIPVTKETLTNRVEMMNKAFEAFSTHLKFQLHEQTGEYYVAIINDQTNEVIREVPPKKFLDMIAAMREQMKGIIVDERK